MTLPTIHRNGTSADTLLSYAMQAVDVLDAARGALLAMSPNLRDFLPQRELDFVKANEEWRVHYEAVLAAIDFARAHAEHAANGAPHA